MIEKEIKQNWLWHDERKEPYSPFSFVFIYRRVVSTDILKVAVSFDNFTYGNTVEIFLQTTSTT